MSEYIELTGMILKTSPVGDYNRRLVILTGEAGKITAFARGARRQGSRLMGATEPFCFGSFKVIMGRDAYSLADANIQRHFEELRTDYDAAVLASYFLEIADYYTRENMEAYEELNLIYASILALTGGRFDRRLVKCVYEIKSMVIAGEFPGIPDSPTRHDSLLMAHTRNPYSDTARYTIERIVASPVRDLYTFSVSDTVIDELEDISRRVMGRIVDRQFNSVKLM